MGRHVAAQSPALLSRRSANRFGGVPTNRRKVRVKWLWSAKPSSVAIRDTVVERSLSRVFPRSMRDRSTYARGLSPVLTRNCRAKWKRR